MSLRSALMAPMDGAFCVSRGLPRQIVGAIAGVTTHPLISSLRCFGNGSLQTEHSALLLSQGADVDWSGILGFVRVLLGNILPQNEVKSPGYRP